MKRVLFLKIFALLLIFGVKTNAQQLDPSGAGGFESGTTFPSNGWTVVNAPTNAWYIGSLGASAGANGMSNADAQSAIAKNTSVGNRSIADDKWQKSGIYGGFTPADELLEKRTENTKVFSKNGKTTAQIGAPMHYLDQSGAWQDIDLKISSTPLLRSGYKFGNESQKIKSYFPEKAGTQNVVINLNNQVDFKWWGTPELKYTVNNTIVKKMQPAAQPGIVHKDKIVYADVYPGMSEEFVILNGGVENNTIIHQLTSEISALPGNAMVEFSQFIQLTENRKIGTPDGVTHHTDFEANYFHISLDGFDDVLTLSPIVIFDNKLDRDEALILINAPKEKLTTEQLAKLNNNLYQSKYYVHFTQGGIVITTKLPASWLQKTGRTFPVTVDPTVVIGATPPGTGSFYTPMSHWYGFQRHANLYLQSQVTGYGMVTEIEYYKTNTTASTNKPTKIFMRTTSATTLTGTAAWNSTTYTGGLTANLDMNTDQGSTTGWKSFVLTNPFNYSADNLLIMTYDAYGGSGSAQYMTYNTGQTGRQAYRRVDGTDPGDGTATAVENYLPTIRITYSNPVCSAMPANGTATTTTPTFNCSGAPVLNATGLSTASNITYQWETSLAGQNSWSNIGGALTLNAAYTAPVTNVSRDYRVKTTCPTFGTSTSAIVTVTVVSAVTGGTATAATQNIACNGEPSLNATGVSLGAGMTYQWQSSPAGQNTWSNVGAPLTTPTLIAPSIAASTDYQVVSTCGPSSTTATSSLVPIAVQSITITPATSSICETNSQVLAAVSPAPSNPTLYSENFNNGLPADMTFVNTSTGTNVAAGAWLIRADGYTDAFETLHSPTNTSFILTNSDDVGSGASVHTEMLTPVLNTSGYNSLTLNFSHYYYHLGSSYGRVEVFNGTSWVQVANYTGANVGSAASFASANISLNAYVNIPNFQVRFVYNAGWDYWWAIDDIVISGTAVASTYTWSSLDPGAGLPGTVNTQSISVTPTNGPGTYTYTVTSNNCGTATATVDVVPGPTATIASAGDVCDGESAILNFTGNPGDVITFNTTESVTIDGAGEASYPTPVLTTGSHTYTINTIANAGCTVTSTLSATQVVNPRPLGFFGGSAIVCQNSPMPATVSFGSFSLPADYPVHVTFSDGVNTYTETANSSSENFTVPNDVAGTFDYIITGLSNDYGCTGIPGTDFFDTDVATVTVNALPSVTVTSAAAGVCEGSSTDVTLAFTGAPPYTFDYYDGTGQASVSGHPDPTFQFTTAPLTTETDYYVTFLQDGQPCLVAGTAPELADTATVVIWDTVAIDVQPLSASACTQNSATITMTATGDMLSYTWYEDGTPVSGPNYTITDNTLVINDVSGLGGTEYHVVVSGCGVDKTSDVVTLTEDFENSWSGTASTAWSDAANWSCGNVPIITTNVVIPATAPFMPLVDITSAICNDFTLDGPGATFGFDATGNMLSIHGNLTNNGGDFNGTDGTVVFAGTDQSITGSTTYEDLEIAGGGTKVLGGDATVTGELILTNGFLSLGNNNLTITNMPAQTTGSAASYIVTDGTGEVVGQNMGADSTVFHVGLSMSYNPVGIKNTGEADTFMVRVMEHVYVDGYGTSPEQMNSPVVDRTWMISEQTPGGSFATVTPQWNAAEEINDFNENHVYLSHYMGGTWTAEYDSAIHAGPRMGSGPYTTMEDSIESFSPFAVGSSGSFPLAIRLTSITAANAGPRNKVEWKSATEAAGDLFELERSADAKTFSRIATVAANGKPSTYLHWDESPVQGVNYYRVKLVDANGNYSYSKVVSATVKSTKDFTIEAYPNPVRSTVSVKVNGVVTGKGSVVVTDVTGKVVTTATVVENNGAELNVSHLANGMYLLNYSDDVRNESIKINKQ